MGKVLRMITKTISTLVLTAVVLLVVLLTGIKWIGYTPYTVLSGSMEPAYHVGSVIYVRNIAADDLRKGDTVTFYISGGTIATHRIVEVIGEGTTELSFRTKGDANEVTDGIIPASAIIGKAEFSIPYLGYVSTFLQNPLGIICVIGICVVLFVISYIIELLFPKVKKAEDMENEMNG